MTKRKQTANGILFLEGCADDCAINGDMIVKEYTFSCGGCQWDPKVMA